MKPDSVHHTCYYLGPWGLLQPTILIMHAWDTLDTAYSLPMGLIWLFIFSVRHYYMIEIDITLTFWDMRLLVVHSERGWQSLVDVCAVYGASPPLPRSVRKNNTVKKRGYSKEWTTTNVRVVFWHWHKYLHHYFLAGHNLSGRVIIIITLPWKKWKGIFPFFFHTD